MNLPNPVAWLCTDFDGHYGIGVTKELAKAKAGEYCNDYLPLHPESAFTAFQQRIEALEAELAACRRDAELVRSLLWDAHPECCGCLVVGTEYMGAQETICCGNPSMDTLNDWQIVNTLRAKFPAIDAARAAQEKA